MNGAANCLPVVGITKSAADVFAGDHCNAGDCPEQKHGQWMKKSQEITECCRIF